MIEISQEIVQMSFKAKIDSTKIAQNCKKRSHEK